VEFLRQIFKKILKYDGHDETNSRSSQFCERAPKNSFDTYLSHIAVREPHKIKFLGGVFDTPELTGNLEDADPLDLLPPLRNF
jgi:hypothetical protein